MEMCDFLLQKSDMIQAQDAWDLSVWGLVKAENWRGQWKLFKNKQGKLSLNFLF